MITAFVALLAADGRAIDPRAAAARALSFARRAGYPDRFEVTSVDEADAKAWQDGSGKLWTVGLRTHSGGWISTNVRQSGEVSYFCVGGFEKPKPSEGVDVERTAWSLIKAVPHKEPLQIDNVGSDNATGGAHFLLLVNGKRFFNMNPTYGYYVRFDVNPRRITWFGRQDEPPPVNAKRAKLSPAQAKDAFMKYAMNPGQYDSVVGLLSPRWPSPMDLTPEAGYYKRKQEPTARIVYRGVVSPRNVKARGARSYLKVFIDALTGERIIPDDQ